MNELTDFVIYTPTVTGVWLIFSALWIDAASNFLSRMFFKIIPFFTGLASLYSGLVLAGVL
jgi:hypothetical protein